MTTLLGTASVLATLAASPAAAQIQGFAGFADVAYSHQSIDLDDDFFGNTDDPGLDGVRIGAGIAFPVDEIPGIAWQLDASYLSQSGDGSSQIVWNLGGSAWWGGAQSRFGININYETVTDFGSETNGGVFVEWYLANFTVAGKGGWLFGGGTPNGGRGNYLGGQVGGYFVPNLWVGGSVTWSDMVSGSTGFGGGIVTPPCFGPTCGRRDFGETNFTIDAEFLVSQAFPLSVFGGYTFSDVSVSENANNPNLIDGPDNNANTFFIGVRYYLGGMGSLMDMHRNGNLRGWLRGAN
jgi:hypothetical protein